MSVERIIDALIKLLVFIAFSMLITTVWVVVELMTLAETQESSEDTIICLLLSLLLTAAVFSKPVKKFLNKA